jgi:hypothetical protein
MYPIDARQLISRSTHGANALDPTRPHRPSRRLRVKTALVAMLRDTERDDPPASVTNTAACADC